MSDDITVKTAKTTADAEEIANAAREIWTEHYTPIIGESQVAYMLSHFQTAERIRAGFTEEGYTYYMPYVGEKLAGYAAARPENENSAVFLSKLYVKSGFRGRGLAWRIVGLIADGARKNGFGCVYLTVNKHNSGSIAAYKRLGFEIVKSMVTDIGGGFVMDDYEMRLKVSDTAGALREN